MIEIQEANTDKPFLFASYAEADKIQVFSDIQKLQSSGVNIWTDISLGRHPGLDWRKIVSHVQSRPLCRGILVFVSRFSLSSTAVQYELEISQSRYVKDMHRGKALPIIPIQVQRYHVLSDFCYDIIEEYGESRDESDIPDDNESVLPSKIVSDIRENFFPDNNILYVNLYDETRSDYSLPLDRLERMDVVNREKKVQNKQEGGIYFAQGKAIFYNIENSLSKKGYIRDRKSKEDAERGIILFENAAAYDYREAYLYIGKLIISTGMTNRKQYKRCHSCFLRALDYGFEESLFYLAVMFYNAKDYKLANKYINLFKNSGSNELNTHKKTVAQLEKKIKGKQGSDG